MRILSFIFSLMVVASATAQMSPEAEKLNDLFHQYYSNMQLDSALIILDQQIDCLQKDGNTDNESKARWNKVAILNNAARYEEMIDAASSQRDWFGQHAIWDRYYQCWQRICSGNQQLGRLQTALREAKAMRDDAQQRNDNTGRAMAYKQMGTIYLYIRQFDQSEEAYRKSVELLKTEANDNGILSGVYEGLCEAIAKQGHFDDELTTAEEWLAHLKVLEEKQSLATVSQTFVPCYLTFCSAYIGKQQYDKASAAIAKAEEYQSMAQSPVTRYDILEMHTRLALAQGHPRQAIAYSDSAIALGVGQNMNLREYRAEAMLLDGNAETSAHIYRALYAEKDSIFTHDMKTQLNELNTLFHVDELRHEQQKARALYAVIVGSIIIIALIVITLLSRRSARRMAEKNRELAEKNAALEIATAKAEESSKMKSEFIRNISHEIRTPLNILNGFTQLLTSPDADMLEAEEKDTMRQQVEDNTMCITSIINKMLELSEALSRTVIERTDNVSPESVVQAAVNRTKAASTADITFTVDTGDDARSIEIQTHQDSAVKALAQLIDNAFKFTGKGEVRLSVSLQPSEVCFVVEDTGIGVPAEESSHIFDEFVQVDSFTDGTGIGLTMARNIAQRLGGDIRLDTEYKNGARFIFTLPR